MQDENQCYMCDDPSSSKEHVPPRCLFPEKKDSDGIDYRKDLITVPSCDLHNMNKSKDDEFLLICLSRLIEANLVGFKLGSSKVRRSLERRPHIMDSVFKQKLTTLYEHEGAKFDLTVGTPDVDRLVSCFEKIFYGIYRHHFGKRFYGKIKVLMGFLKHSSKDSADIQDFLEIRAAEDLSGKPIFGSNPEVFSFQFTEPDAEGLFLCKATFYGNVAVYGAFAEKEPTNFLSLLIQKGVPVIVSHKGKNVTFNKK